MTVTTLDETTALIVVDLQKGIALIPTPHPISGIVENTNRLAEAFRAHGLPVVRVTVAGGAPGRIEARRPGGGERPADWADPIPELSQHPDDVTVVKRTWGAFTGTGLDEKLKALGVTQVVVTGVATSIGVESTARQAHEHGYHVTLATDAMTDSNLDAHDGSIARIFPRLGETGTVDEILQLLGERD